MKKNVLALSIATMVGGLGFAGAANADLLVNESGAGHILMVPYYTAQNGNMSVFHITNTDQVNGKAVKVRFRGASNSDDVLDFQVFMSPGDVWTAAVTKDAATGKAKLTTADNSCTYPAIPAEGVTFVTDRLAHPAWNEAAKAEQTLEGYVEILTMSDIPKATVASGKVDDSLYTAIKHVNGKAPCTSTVLAKTLNLTTPASTYKISHTTDVTGDDLVAPSLTPSLTGQWYVMNVEKTTTFSAAMPAIAATTAANNVFSPQKNGTAALTTADPLMAAGAITPQFYDVPDLSTPYETATGTAAAQAIALTNAIARTAVLNQYASDAGIDAKTDWVFSMPTRRYSIAANYTAKTNGGAATAAGISQVAGGVVSTANTDSTVTLAGLGYRVVNADVTGNEFTAVGTTYAVAGGKTSVNAAGQICLTASATKFWDREETTPTAASDQPVFSPGTPSKPATFDLCGEVSVLAFSADESALGAKLSRQNVDAKYVNGWGEVSFAGNVPVLGSAFVKLSNPSAREGVSGTYGLTWAHAYK